MSAVDIKPEMYRIYILCPFYKKSLTCGSSQVQHDYRRENIPELLPEFIQLSLTSHYRLYLTYHYILTRVKPDSH